MARPGWEDFAAAYRSATSQMDKDVAFENICACIDAGMEVSDEEMRILRRALHLYEKCLEALMVETYGLDGDKAPEKLKRQIGLIGHLIARATRTLLDASVEIHTISEDR